MATIVEANLKTLDNGRQRLVDVGLRPTRVWKRLGVWDGGEIHLGDLTETDTEITPRPKVEHVGNSLRVSGITPDYGTGGWSTADLSPETANATDFYYVVQVPGGALSAYRLADINTTKAFGYVLRLEPLDVNRPDEF